MNEGLYLFFIPPEDQWVQITKKGLHFYKWVNLGFTFHSQLFLPNLFGSVTYLYCSHSKHRQYLGFLFFFFLTEVIGNCQVIKVDDKGEGDNSGSLQNWRTFLRSWGKKTVAEFGRKMIESGDWASNSQTAEIHALRVGIYFRGNFIKMWVSHCI